MAMKVTRENVWVGPMADAPGAMSKKLAKLASAGVNLEFVLGRRMDGKKGRGIAFVAPIASTAKAKKAGFAKSPRLAAVRVAGNNRRGIGAKISAALGDAGINLRGLVGQAIGGKFVIWLALDSGGDAAKAVRVLKKL